MCNSGLTFTKTSYRNNNALAVIMNNGVDDDVITVNLNDFMQDDEHCAYVDVNNYPGIEKVLVDNGIAEPMGFSTRSGFVEYPLYYFNL